MQLSNRSVSVAGTVIIIRIRNGLILGCCIPNLKNIAVREGTLDVHMDVIASHCALALWVHPTADESSGYEIINSNCTVDSTLADLYYVNQSGLIIRNSTTTKNGQPTSTSGLYVARCNNIGEIICAKLLVIRKKNQLLLILHVHVHVIMLIKL